MILKVLNPRELASQNSVQFVQIVIRFETQRALL